MAADRSALLDAFSSFGADERKQLLTDLLLSIPSADRRTIICEVAAVGALGDDRTVRLTDFDVTQSSKKNGAAAHCSKNIGVFGCPWCRRPLEIRNAPVAIPQAPSETGTAFCALLYGNSLQYFIGALVLGWGLRQEPHDRVLIHTDDVTLAQRKNLEKVGWKLHPVQYLKGAEEVSSTLFHSVWRTRFRNVFTKIQVLALPYSKVVLLDLDILVRKPLTGLTALPWPAAHARGDPALHHGEIVPYRRFWENYDRRQFNGKVEKLPNHQQSSGINAGVMVLPGNRSDLLEHITRELSDWDHPEHYPTYMPEQEYLSRWFGTFEGPWRHVGCEYNYEIDKDVRVPFDFSTAHKRFKADHQLALTELAAVHFSGGECKPWDRLFKDNEFSPDQMDGTVPCDPLMEIFVREWFQQFREAWAEIDADGLDEKNADGDWNWGE